MARGDESISNRQLVRRSLGEAGSPIGNKKSAVHSGSNRRTQRPQGQTARARLPSSTRRKHAYGCFLPDLTRFTAHRCRGSNLQHRQRRGWFYERQPSHGEFSPVIADYGSSRRTQGTASAPPSTARHILRNLLLTHNPYSTRGARWARHRLAQACTVIAYEGELFFVIFVLFVIFMANPCLPG